MEIPILVLLIVSILGVVCQEDGNDYEEKPRDCVLGDRGIDNFCQAVDELFPHQNRKFHNAICNCIGAFLSADISRCNRKSYNLPGADSCARLFTHNTFRKMIIEGSGNPTYRTIKTILDKKLDACNKFNSGEDSAYTAVETFLKKWDLICAFTIILKAHLSPEEATLFSDCIFQWAELLTPGLNGKHNCDPIQQEIGSILAG